MYYYIYVKLNKITELTITQITDTIDRFFGKVIDKTFELDTFVIIIKDHVNKDRLNEYFENFLLDNFLKGKIYISNNFTNQIDLEKEKEIVSLILTKNNFIQKHSVYSFKELLNDSLMFNNTTVLKKYLLGRFYNNNEYEVLLRTFFSNNLNVLKTARDLNMHRNTVIYRLDSFLKETNFDPRDFNDAFIIKLLVDY